MEYTVQEIDIADKDKLRKINDLLTFAYGDGSDPMPPDKLYKNTTTNSKHPSLYLAAVLGDEIIGFNSFISHDLILNGQIIHGYQSGWSATSTHHRGKKIFQNIINGAKEILLKKEAAFIFGFPNAESHPIFTKKLGFKEFPFLKWQMPNLPLVKTAFFNSYHGNIDSLKKNAILQNDNQLIDLKKKEHRDQLKVFDYRKSFIWGIFRKKVIRGITLSYFEIGGMEIQQVDDFAEIFKVLYKNTPKAAFYQFTSCQGNSYNNLFKTIRPAQTNNLIVFDLNMDTSENVNFNLFGGVKDVY